MHERNFNESRSFNKIWLLVSEMLDDPAEVHAAFR
jgi:hypothetical protein